MKATKRIKKGEVTGKEAGIKKNGRGIRKIIRKVE